MKIEELIKGDGTWSFKVEIEGNDLVVRNVRATCFGGASDPQDSGATASGISTKANPLIRACALPMRYDGPNKALKAVLGGSPVPRLPWLTLVEVTDIATYRKMTLPVIDLGPAKKTGNAIDLTVAAARRFNPKASATNFEMRCNYRIIEGASLCR